MQIGKKKKIKVYPRKVPRREAIPAPDIFNPKRQPAKIPVELPQKVEQ